MLNESDRNLPLITPAEATMTDYLIAVRVFLLLQNKEHANVHSIASVRNKEQSTTASAPTQFVPAKAA
jgi:hypothetical protein